MTAATMPSTKCTNVGMGQIALVRSGEAAKAVLGSCIGLALYHPRYSVATVAHIVLAKSEGREGMPGKFADTAIPEMLKMLAGEQVSPHGLVAKLAGGANMFGSNGPIQVGESNHAAVLSLLREAKVRVAGENVGGSKGRRVTFDPKSKEMLIEIAGSEPICLS